jgi:hypothetical protein
MGKPEKSLQRGRREAYPALRRIDAGQAVPEEF